MELYIHSPVRFNGVIFNQTWGCVFIARCLIKHRVHLNGMLFNLSQEYIFIVKCLIRCKDNITLYLHVLFLRM